MILVKPSHEIVTMTPNMIEFLESIGRVCYKTEGQINKGSAKKFIKMIMKRGHLSVIEHAIMTVRFICDRGVSHELVRHRVASYSQESTRYCNYKGGVSFVIPPWLNVEPGDYDKDNAAVNSVMHTSEIVWLKDMAGLERSYIKLLAENQSPQQARAVLPNSTKTEIVVTANIREWLHILRLRCHHTAHPQMVELMDPLLCAMNRLYPDLFGAVYKETRVGKEA